MHSSSQKPPYQDACKQHGIHLIARLLINVNATAARTDSSNRSGFSLPGSNDATTRTVQDFMASIEKSTQLPKGDRSGASDNDDVRMVFSTPRVVRG